ncbi:HNH endonuclease signature motif containing protein [Lacisediminihabitans changchengi]|uniref:DUF222 domain-containing protein n=1 Tax=Lacisediminihabitans changchengi TaxID=2787634 RepID=A0A934W2U6_9MICO|nr:HNH endonuclease signature motif containing protein [Lacisediminihabitans changchengi]MBK4347206.1 DUF222 domain-containing protein [Lacisediminihabitans changchengi]
MEISSTTLANVFAELSRACVIGGDLAAGVDGLGGVGGLSGVYGIGGVSGVAGASPEVLLRMIADAGTVQRAVDAIRVRLAGELVEQSAAHLGSEGIARQAGHRHAASFLAELWQISVPEAARLCAVGAGVRERRALDGSSLPARYPVLGDAMRSGSVSVEVAAAIVHELDQAAPFCSSDARAAGERLLVEHAPGLTVKQVHGLARHHLSSHRPQLAAEANIIPIVLGGSSEVLDVGHGRRLFTSAQRHALAETYGGCAFPGCGHQPSHTEAHHLVCWAKGGRTDLNNSEQRHSAVLVPPPSCSRRRVGNPVPRGGALLHPTPMGRSRPHTTEGRQGARPRRIRIARHRIGSAGQRVSGSADQQFSRSRD